MQYSTGYYREQSPAWINIVCLLNGIEPVPLDQPYTCFELGFGRGLTAQVLAAGNPQGRFYAADFNPAHVAGASRLAAQAQLHNLTLLEDSFEQLAGGSTELPQFDFITLHGIYTWVNADNRRHIVRFIERYLKPGGLVYVSYNAMPGWSAALPLQRLLVEYADLFPNRSDLQMTGATDFVNLLGNMQARYLTQNPSLATQLDSLRTAKPAYLVHEYLHKHWQPLFHADVARDLSAAKMDFAGSADLPHAYPALYASEEQQGLLAQISDPAMRETLKDYFLNTSFRKDVFVRGAVRMSAARQAEWLERIGLVLTVPRSLASGEIKLAMGEWQGDAAPYEAVLDAIALRPHTLAELAAIPALARQDMPALAQIAVLLCASNQVELYLAGNADAPADAARRLNRILAGQVRYGDEHAALCAPLLGGAVAADAIEQLFYLGLEQEGEAPGAAALARFAWQTMAPIRRNMLRGGSVPQSDIDNLPALKKIAEKFVAEKLPVWRSLHIVREKPCPPPP